MPSATKDNAGWLAEYTIAGTGEKTITFKTENKFMDSDARVLITTPAAANPTLTLTDKTDILTMGTASSGTYSPKVSVSGKATVATAGWISNGDYTVAASNYQVGKVNQSILKNGNSTIASGSTINPGPVAQTISITEGYNTARTLVIGSASSSDPGAVTSGSATISTLNYGYVAADGIYNITGSADVSAPNVDTAGYVSGSIGTLNANTNGATVATTVPAITLAASLTGTTTTLKPTISRRQLSIEGVTDASDGSATSTAPTSGVYVSVWSDANTGTITATPSITAAGYGTGANFTAGTFASVTIGAARSDQYYIPIKTTTASAEGRTVSYGSGWIAEGSTSIGLGKVTSGAGTATISTPTYDATAAKFTQSASGTIAAPTVNTAGYVSTTEGTKNANSISGTKTLDVVQVGATVTGTAKVTPAITRTAKPSGDSWVDAASGAATTTKPSSGAYVQVNAAAQANNLTITGKVSGEGYGTTSNYLTDASTVTSVGSNAAAATYVPITAGTVTSGTATISSATYTYDSTNDNFTVTGSANVSAPTFTEGYISTSVGTKNAKAGGATLSTTVNKVAIAPTLKHRGDYMRKPYIALHENTNVEGVKAATTTQPASGYYIAISSPANTSYVWAEAAVTSAGYGTTTDFASTDTAEVAVGAAASDVTYMRLREATFANSATSGTTYTDISASVAPLISGDYLYINAGYTPAQKISLAQLIPDATDTNAPANYILSGYTAYDNAGTLIVGTMSTYDGTYTVT